MFTRTFVCLRACTVLYCTCRRAEHPGHSDPASPAALCSPTARSGSHSCHPAAGSLATSSGWALASLQDTEVQLSSSSWEPRHQLRLGSGFPTRYRVTYLIQQLGATPPAQAGLWLPYKIQSYTCHPAAGSLATSSGSALGFPTTYKI